MKVGDLVIESFEGLGVVTTEPYVYQPKDADTYDVVLVRFFQYGDTFEVDCDELKVISESR